MTTTAILVFSLLSMPPAPSSYISVHVNREPLEVLSFLAGDWHAVFETFPEVYGSQAGRSAGTVRGEWGPQRARFEMEAHTTLPGIGAYMVRVVVHRGADDATYHAYAVTTLGGGVTYAGRFENDSTLVFTGRIGDIVQRVSYEKRDPNQIRSVVEESRDGGRSFVRHSEAWWTRADHTSRGRVMNFEVAADDPERAASFYRDVFQWTVTRWDGPWEYWEIETGPADEPGINGGLVRRTEPGTQPLSVVYVASIDEILHRIGPAGGRIVEPKVAIPGVGWQAVFLDPERNRLALFQLDSSAK